MCLYDWVAQAKRDSKGTGDLPAVFHKKNYAEVLVTMPLDDWMQLYREWEAGQELEEGEKMSDVKWIKITTDMFDNRKIRHLRKLPEGNSIVLIWVMLLAMAGKCNDHGKIYLTENIPYTPKMLADELDFEENTVQLALQALEQLDMIVLDDGYFPSLAGKSIRT